MQDGGTRWPHLLLHLIFSLFAIHDIEMVWLLLFLIDVRPLLKVYLLTYCVLFLVQFPYRCHFQSYQNLSSSLWDGVYFFKLHCSGQLTMYGIEVFFRTIPVCIQLLFWQERTVWLLINIWSSLDSLTVDFSSFALLFMLMFSKGSSVCSFLFISNSEADVLELLLVVRSTKMAKYGSTFSAII